MRNNIHISISYYFQAAVFAILILTISQQATAVNYTITDLGQISNYGWSAAPSTYALAINNNGQVVGFSNGVGFLYNNEVMSSVGNMWEANAINNSGQIAGYSSYPYHASLYSNGITLDLGTFSGGISTGQGINDYGQVVGKSWISSNVYHAFLYNNGVMTDLGTFGGANSDANGINNSGQVSGGADAANGQFAFLYSNGVMTNLGTLGGTNSYAWGINNNSQVTGTAATASGFTHAFLYSNGVMTDLGALGGGNSFGYGINDKGQVVGSTVGGAFLYSEEQMIDLNTFLAPSSGWSRLDTAYAINDSGQIVGAGYINGIVGTRAFLMTPTSVVPVPATFWLFGSGLLGLLSIASRCKTRN